ncbi:aminomethyl-transferring glycine dehydrogenase subunit GcvPA [Tissierella creatinophila]|uniref:Probable glycine dehydrogenase (decarboxylating) subunit 1 n=1 Tax=Tissierella creatinophila DSM 6911 TaxID=1123403 RepID=A0A1U7M496_TISCR|nr:aminomethyl-transferring glycine dehydrogenase subunit GcvPA [Tissierella creatinophila]OLS02105.1 putative glycine dehydrogenase (decarboxylating) subunit 1 [Tissierella creatinophila DSM 6911]
MFPYIPHTPEDEKIMLDSIGVNSVDDLFADIPKDVAFNKELDLPLAKSELEVTNYLNKLANKNCSTTENVCFLGAGAYDHYIPAIIDHIISRSEFYTSYTPYQPEISQGTLQYIFEYQTLISELTGLPIANASLYDGGTAVAEAALMACDVARKKKILISETVSPQSRQVLKTYAHMQDIEVVEVAMKDGITDMEDLEGKMDDDVATVIVQSPNFFGVVEDLKSSADLVHKSKKASIIASVDPISLGILKRPGDLGVDIVVGEGQSLGMSLSFGGPYLGFLATTEKYLRKLPGRIVGETTDLDGKRSFVLTLTAREQHIRRDKATSNICSNQGLNTLVATVYMVTLGKEGLREVAMQSTKKAHYALEKLEQSGKYKRVFDKPFFKEFAVSSNIDADKIIKDLRSENIIAGHHLGIDYPEFKDSILYAVTEKRTKDEIDKLSSVLEGI